MKQIKKFTEEFFKNIKSGIEYRNNSLIIKNVPKSFEDIFGKPAPYYLVFSNPNRKEEVVEKGSRMLSAMLKYLEGTGKTTLLKIDFKIDPKEEIKKSIRFKNCEIENSVKRYKNNFFSRFSFATIFNYLNESERIVNEIYVYDGKIINGDLSGYDVIDGNNLAVRSNHIKKDYNIAHIKSIEITKAKQEEITNILKQKAESEISKIQIHYNNRIKEISGELNGKLDKIKEIELKIKKNHNDEELIKKLWRLKHGLVKTGNDEAVEKISQEKEMTIRDIIHKYSLDIDRKLINTTIIYYPTYTLKVFIRGSVASKRFIEIEYDPLTKHISKLNCEVCKKELKEIQLCKNGHISCNNCLEKCGDCGNTFCLKCLSKTCNVCGKKLCKNCVKTCMGCGKNVCSTHLRKDCVSGEDRCTSCLRACLKCHGMAEEKYFGIAMDGSKVCQKCLGEENLKKRLKRNS